MKLSMIFLSFFSYTTIISLQPAVVYMSMPWWREYQLLDFHCFKALNNYLEARLFVHVHF